MKAKEALNLLRITRKTLYVYATTGKIRYTVMPNGYYDYNDEDVYKLSNRDVKRKTVIYAGVATNKQKKRFRKPDLLKRWCFMNGYTINAIYTDISSGISFEEREGFFEMPDEILNYRVEKVIITYKDRLSRVGFELFKYLFQRFGAEIVVVSEAGDPKLDADGIEGIGLYPRSLSILEFMGMITSKAGC